MIVQTSSFIGLTHHLDELMKHQSERIHTEKWQGYDISKRPEAEMHEVVDTYIKTLGMNGEDVNEYRNILEPNLPWADDHFIERVSGEPLNPGETWKTWPWALKADQSRIFHGKFSHTYMERYWPRRAGSNPTVEMDGENFGHRFRYGDLYDVVSLLEREPLTRQAYLPIFFPEDTGAVHGNRVPCTLGYHWIVRDNKINTFYPIRSCDYFRHFRDDVYMTTRLTLWLLQQLRSRNPYWNSVTMGSYSMWIGSLHLFRNDYIKLFGAPHD